MCAELIVRSTVLLLKFTPHAQVQITIYAMTKIDFAQFRYLCIGFKT